MSPLTTTCSMGVSILHAADEEGLELTVLEDVDDHRHTDLARLLEVGGADVREPLRLLQERVGHLELRQGLLELLDVGDGLLARDLQGWWDHLERVHLGTGLVVPLTGHLDVPLDEALHLRASDLRRAGTARR